MKTDYIQLAKAHVESHLERNIDPLFGGNNHALRTVIRNYTAAFAGHFTDWIGRTLPWVRSPEAQFALLDNQRCEQAENHTDMLLDFSLFCGASPDKENHDQVYRGLRDVRLGFINVKEAGLYGLMVLATLENTSELFIPRLEKMAIALGCHNVTYTQKHGLADVPHSEALLRALDVESDWNYQHPDQTMRTASEITINLLRDIFDKNVPLAVRLD